MLIGALAWAGCSARPEALADGEANDWSHVDGAIVRSIGRDAVIDWTNLQLRVTEGASGAARLTSVTYVTVEDSARSLVESLYRERIERVPIGVDTDLGDVMTGELREITWARIARWEVVEATYTTSGRVDLVGALSLQTLLKPWFMSHTRPGGAPLSDWAGVVVDARGFDVRPSYLQSLLAPDGTALYRGEMWEEEAVAQAPFVFVRDPGPLTPEVLQLRAADVSGDQIRLDAASARLVGENPSALGRSTVVVVMDDG